MVRTDLFQVEMLGDADSAFKLCFIFGSYVVSYLTSVPEIFVRYHGTLYPYCIVIVKLKAVIYLIS